MYKVKGEWRQRCNPGKERGARTNKKRSRKSFEKIDRILPSNFFFSPKLWVYHESFVLFVFFFYSSIVLYSVHDREGKGDGGPVLSSCVEGKNRYERNLKTGEKIKFRREFTLTHITPTPSLPSFLNQLFLVLTIPLITLFQSFSCLPYLFSLTKSNWEC